MSIRTSATCSIDPRSGPGEARSRWPVRAAPGVCEDVAAALFVHPQTVRYRMGQLRELYGDGLEDPATVLALTVALA